MPHHSIHPLYPTRREYIKPDGTIGYRSTLGWYERSENNGWRPISERILVDEDPVTTMTKLKRQPLFHFNPGMRRSGAPGGGRGKQAAKVWTGADHLELDLHACMICCINSVAGTDSAVGGKWGGLLQVLLPPSRPLLEALCRDPRC